MNWIDKAAKNDNRDDDTAEITKGIRRDVFAALAMHGLLSGPGRVDIDTTEQVAKKSVMVADALIAEIDKEPQ